MARDAAVRRRWARLADAGLTVAAVLGAVCIVLAVAAVLFDVRIVMFRTGSMSPTIPAGSAAVVHGIPAADIRVGDVVMVERAGQLPVTHRVVGVDRIPGDDDARSIRMRGDANDVDDPMPYEVREVRRIVFAVPGVAPVLVALGTPWVMGGITIAATALIVVVFWPRRRRNDVGHEPEPGPEPEPEPATEPEPGPKPEPEPSTEAASATETAQVPDDGPAPPGSRRARRAAGIGAAVALVLVSGSLAAAPAPAHAGAGVTESVIQGRVIRLVSIEEPAMRALVPGASAVWQVGVMADAATPGTIAVTLAGTGADAAGLLLQVQGCGQRWAGAACPAPELLVDQGSIPRDGMPRLLRTVRDDEQLWLRLLVTMPEDAGPAVSDVNLVVRATGAGDDISTEPGGGLAVTGAVPRWGLIGVGIVLTAVGVGVVLRVRRRS